MPKNMTNKTGDAEVMAQGHTSNSNFGSNVNAKARWSGNASKLSKK